MFNVWPHMIWTLFSVQFSIFLVKFWSSNRENKVFFTACMWLCWCFRKREFLTVGKYFIYILMIGRDAYTTNSMRKLSLHHPWFQTRPRRARPLRKNMKTEKNGWESWSEYEINIFFAQVSSSNTWICLILDIFLIFHLLSEQNYFIFSLTLVSFLPWCSHNKDIVYHASSFLKINASQKSGENTKKFEK